ncbi:MAG: OmpH family outer membrane protein [Alphaproteobacteria bacterium]|nr:OmpH family outer membrane protein [Alphaproteobacteria bacterium]
MFGRITYFSIFLICITALSNAIAPAMAQTDKPPENLLPPIGIVNFQTVLVSSLAWQDFRNHIEQESLIFEKNVNKMVAEIEALEKNIKRKGQHLSKEALRAQNSKLSTLRLRYQRQLQEQKNILDNKYVKAQDYIRQKIYTILQRISKEKNMPLILNAGTTTNAVLVADKQLDITKETLDSLNQELPKLTDNFYRNLAP